MQYLNIIKSQFCFWILYILKIVLIYFIIYTENFFCAVVNIGVINYERLLYFIIVVVKFALNMHKHGRNSVLEEK